MASILALSGSFAPIVVEIKNGNRKENKLKFII